MKTAQDLWSPGRGWGATDRSAAGRAAHLVLAFGAPEALKRPGVLGALKERHPEALVVACSTAGEIAGDRVLDGTVVATAVIFEDTRVRGVDVRLDECGDAYECGVRLARALDAQDLRHVLVLSDGLAVNGSRLAAGLAGVVGTRAAVTGGLSGDGDRFGETLVGLDGEAAPGRIIAIGFYGRRLSVGFGSLGGWDPFGPERRITRSRGNVLYELDGQSALGLYKRFLGEYAAGLPASGLLFPLCLRDPDGANGVVRTILGVDEREQTLTFAGDVPEGSFARLMRANFDRLIDGAHGAAAASLTPLGARPAELAILISCVGRKLVLQQRVEEEVESVRDVLGADACFTGFYSYGEISPLSDAARCELHNQTMTITALSER